MKLQVFLAFFLVSFGVFASTEQAFAGTLPLSIDAKTNKNFYEYGENVGVSGKIRNYDSEVHSGKIVTFTVLDPNGERSAMGQAEPGLFGAFSFNFIAKGEKFLLDGNYSIQITFESVTNEFPMFFSGGELEIEDVTRPIIQQPADIEVTAESFDERVQVTFEVFATDDVDGTIIPTCKPESGFLFGIGETIIKCTAKDSSDNFALPVSFTIKVNPPLTVIPVWVKDVAEFWCQDQIDDASFVQGIQYLIDNGIIVVPAKSSTQGAPQEIPQWVRNNACWWSEGSITDLDFASGIEYLVKQGIIIV